LGERVASEKFVDERRVRDALELNILNFMGDEDGRLFTDDELQQKSKKLVVCLKAVLVCKAHLFVFSHLIVEINVDES